VERKTITLLGLLILVGATLILAPVAAATTAKTILGADLYFDASLSEPSGQACADCHQPFAGYADPVQALPVSEGVIRGEFGGRNAPSAAYMGKSPKLYQDADGVWIGGAFWDGRASGWTDGSPLIEQAKGPFLNPVEMHNTSKWQVVRDVKRSSYAWLFKAVYGWNAFADVDRAYHNIADAIAAFERSSLVNTFSSRYDAFDRGATWVLTKQEKKGLTLFNGKALCNQCHPSAGSAPGKALFTDFSYDNLGLPANPDFTEPPLGFDAVPDVGLGGFLRSPAGGQTEEVAALSDGAFKVPTLRNVGKTAPYGHNGAFMTLKEIVHFYNTRDVPGAGWDPPEVPQNVNVDELGDLGLSATEEAAIVAFLRTLNDRVEFRPFSAH
jgi:cytochrome c peroxidase